MQFPHLQHRPAPSSRSLLHCVPATKGEQAQGKGGGSEGDREAEPLPGCGGCPVHPGSQSVPTARDVAPPFGTVPIRSTPRLEVWLSPLSSQLRIPCLCHSPGLSAPPCSTACGLSQGPRWWGGGSGDRPLSRLRVGGLCKLNGWPSWSWAGRRRERAGTSLQSCKTRGLFHAELGSDSWRHGVPMRGHWPGSERQEGKEDLTQAGSRE